MMVRSHGSDATDDAGEEDGDEDERRASGAGGGALALGSGKERATAKCRVRSNPIIWPVRLDIASPSNVLVSTSRAAG
jgi:hypothetical protein